MKKLIYLSILILCISNIAGCSNENIEETGMQTESLENERGTGYVLSTEQRAEREDTKQYYKYSELERTLERSKKRQIRNFLRFNMLIYAILYNQRRESRCRITVYRSLLISDQ